MVKTSNVAPLDRYICAFNLTNLTKLSFAPYCGGVFIPKITNYVLIKFSFKKITQSVELQSPLNQKKEEEKKNK